MLDPRDFKNKIVTIMGLGVHGGGLASANFFLQAGAKVIITDLRSPEILAPSLSKLIAAPWKLRLEEHREEDFRQADLVIKNPGVPAKSPFLTMAKNIETDISIFCQLVENPILAITGTKGKSTTASALAWIIQGQYPEARLGGNITVSPLTFWDQLNPEAPVILELSSWQLGDIRKKASFRPKIVTITNILHDHQNAYDRFEDYVADKMVIFENLNPEDSFILNPGSAYADTFRRKNPGRLIEIFQTSDLLPERLPLPGEHNRDNLQTAGEMAYAFGLAQELIRERISSFPGVPHRQEKLGEKGGFTFINDTAATIPDALALSVDSYQGTLYLICGGADKELIMDPILHSRRQPTKAFLLEGTATGRMKAVMESANWKCEGPFTTLKEAFEEILQEEPGIVLLSPGAASFGMFANEFDRGNQFRDLVQDWLRQ
jgi:UDP-N-acetylmuramoylalanine--D-glutamate ligase